MKEPVTAFCMMLSQQLPVGNEKNYEKASRDSQPPD
jgi:hypothetical protein